MNVDLSQGSHFFHNISSFDVSYFSVPFHGRHPASTGKAWHGGPPSTRRTSFVTSDSTGRCCIEVDGRQGRGGDPLGHAGPQTRGAPMNALRQAG